MSCAGIGLPSSPCVADTNTSKVLIRRRRLGASLADKRRRFFWCLPLHCGAFCVCMRVRGHCACVCDCVRASTRARVRPSSSNHTLMPEALPHSVALPPSASPSLLPPRPLPLLVRLPPWRRFNRTDSRGRPSAAPSNWVSNRLSDGPLAAHFTPRGGVFKRRCCFCCCCSCATIQKVTQRRRRCFPHLFIFIIIFKQKAVVSRASEGALKFLSGIYRQTQISEEEVRDGRVGVLKVKFN